MIALLGLVGVMLLAAAMVAAWTALIVSANRAIGQNYDAKRAALEEIWRSERIRYAEDGIRMRVFLWSPFGFRLQWMSADVRVTSRAIYLAQYRLFGGRRMGQPIVAMPLGEWELDPSVKPLVLAGRVSKAPSIEGDAVVLKCRIGIGRFTWRIPVPRPSELLSATVSTIE